MKRAYLFVFPTLAGLVWGCGGGGGGGSTSTSFGNLLNAHLVATFAADSSRGIDSRDLVAGDVVVVQIFGTDPTTGNVVQGTVGTWSVTAPGSVAVIQNSGQLTTIGSSGATYQIVATNGSATFSTTLKVSALQARVAGRLRTSNDERLRNIPVKFLNATGAVVGTAYTSGTGDFYANVPTTAVSFIADLASRSDRYYNQYSYGPRDYSASVSGCKAALPAITSGSLTRLPNDLVTYLKSAGSPPPPPPSGCLL